MNKRSYSSVLLLLVSLLVLAGCGDRAARSLELLDSAATSSPEELDAERRRLDSLQLVRWVDSAGDEFFMPVGGLADLDDDYCDFYNLCPGVTSGENCLHQACTNRVRLCTARFLQSAALVRAEPLVLPRAYKLKANPPSPSDLQNLANYDLVNIEAKVPPQSVSTRTALLRFALGISREVVNALTNYSSCPHSTDPNDAYLVSLSGAKTLPWQPTVRASGLWAETTVEAVNFYRELSEDTVDVILAAADAQRSSSSTTAQGAARSVAGAQLSRAEAAHLLVGGAPGILGDTTKAFCSSPELGASEKSALQVLRRAAPDPADILNKSVDIGTLLNAGTAAFAHGSVRVRLEALSGSTISSVEEEVGLSREDFVQARSYMAQEIRTFSRDVSVTFAPEATGTIPGGMSFYAATGREPIAPPAEYWAAIARSGQWINTGGSSRELLATDVASTLSLAFGRTRQALGLVDGNAYILGTVDTTGETHQQFQGPLNLLASQDEEVGQFALRYLSGAWRIIVSGYDVPNKIRVVQGLSGLLCATRGRIEGEPCPQSRLDDANMTLTTLTSVVTQPYFYVGLGHENAVYSLVSILPADELLFVVKPKDSAQEVPGGYDALGGISLKGLPGGTTSRTYRFPLIPELDRKVGEILRPSEKWCTHPAVECDGTLFDERLPLENELSDDGDGVESSWRHYLTLAEQAAQEAHLLGEQYLQNGLEVDRQLEAEQIREVQDRQRYLSRIEGEMETVQDICGIAMDTTEFVGLFGGTAVGPTNGLSCSAPADCCGGVVGPTSECPYSCTNNVCIPTACAAGTGSDCPAPYQCINRRCVYSPDLHLQQEQGSSEGISRLQECIGNGTVIDYVALGTEPLCLWDGGTADPTSLCAGANEQYPCPRVARRLVNGAYDCNVPTPPGTTPKLVDTRLGLADASALVSGQDACQLLRAYRNHQVLCPGGAICPGSTPPSTVLDYLSKALTPALLSPQHLARATSLGWRVEFPTDEGGNISSVLVDGKVKWTTAPNAPGWPCTGYRPYNPSDPAIACPDPSALFCTTLAGNCAQDTSTRRDDAARLNARLFTAVAVLKGLTLGDFDKLEVPVELPAEALASLGQPVTTRDAGRHFEQQFTGGLWRLYDDDSDATAPAAFWRFLEFNQNMSETVTSFDVPALNGSLLLRQPLPAAPSELLPHTDALLASVIHVEDAFSLSSWAAYFNAERPLPISDPGVLSGDMDNPYLTPRLEYTEGALEDAAELLCEVTRDDTWSFYPTDCAEKSVTELTSSQDFSALKEYGVCRLQAFSRAVGSLVLPRIPARAVEGVRSFSVAGGFPAVGGEMGEQILRLRGALTRYSEFTQTMAESAQQINDIADRMNFALVQIGLQSSADQAAYEIAQDNGVIASFRGAQASIRMTQIQFQKQAATWKATLDCFQATTTGLLGGAGGGLAGLAGGLSGGAASCFASFTNAGIERQNLDYESQIAGVEAEITKIQAQIAGQAALIEQNRALLNQIEHAREMLDLRAQLRGAFATMASVTTEAQASLDEVRASLTDIESLRLKVQRSIGRALQFETTQAAVTENIDAVLNSRLNVSKKRYLQAHENAVKLAFLAKRAIEQRLGMHLSELRADMPLVDAPASWESDVCAAEGIDYEAIRAKAAETGTETAVPVDYSNPYIGDYVTKLKNVVESYRLQFDFHEGTDEAIVSLRDDLLNVRAPCSEFAGNLLKYSAELDHLVTADAGAGWQILGCTTTSTEGVATSCLEVGRHTEEVVPNAPGMTLLWGSTSASDSRLAQKVALKPGRYRLSWYSPMRAGDAGPEVEAALYGDEGAPLDPVSFEDYVTDLTDIWSRPSPTGDWPRHYRFFDVRPEFDELYVTLVRAEPGTGTALGVGAIMLERVSDGDATNPQFLSPPPFVATSDSLETIVPDCEDTGGQVFKQSAWEYRCAKLCTDGFSDNCLDSSIGDRCYWETNFSIDQRSIEAGRIFTQSGFARGNFNYRIEDLAVNFVGSDVRDCENSGLPITCFSAGFVPYTLKHIGPFFVRNHSGGDFQVKLFNGNIEHARGLGIERYLTNPLSSTDRELMSAYVRSEFRGRPLDGNFALRVWDEGITIDAIQDVQLYIKYRYWTRFD